jgi:hypothetical protein
MITYPSFFNLPQSEMQYLASKAIAAQNAWKILEIAFIAENIALGITQLGKSKLVADTFEKVLIYGQAGSLWEALKAIDAIVILPEMAPFVTQARVNWFKNQLQQAIAEL